ncbi:molybdenum cofactor guanylyltransferase [Marinigracilibium pacificum]|uniref:Probable molybdenum cofactor guanylyltransferase n=1 Tax=Marinigracilibium pacificum TaxID=2729599 RepID=A0A848J774_9BACT|nr:molybdenum cofactor guanylyltransferase [Marinigracilibium pacificum]NMM50350.1 molybdenum cofactor guanylyltransferase [Marinigracilibium pacificum]
MVIKSDITGIILAGGNSTRMGTDKALMQLNGKSFLTHILDALKPITNEIILVSNHKEHQLFNLKCVSDILPAGPLAGIYTGLYHSKTEYNLVLSCDVPLITTNLLKILVDNITNSADVIQLEANGQIMPLVALYKKKCAPVFLDLLQNGERRVQFALGKLSVKTLTLSKKDWNKVTNVNTSEEWQNLIK